MPRLRNRSGRLGFARLVGRTWIVCIAAVMPTLAAAGADSRGEILTALRLTPDFERGASLYQRACMRCHGADGGGAPDGSVPAIAAQHTSVIVKQLVDFGQGARSNIRMAHVLDHEQLQSPQQLADVAGYVNGLERSGARRQGPGQYVARGGELYAHECASCHGDHAQGERATAVPLLAGQNYEYLVRQLSYARDGQRPGLARDHARILAEFSTQDTSAVADYLSRAALPADAADAPARQ